MSSTPTSKALTIIHIKLSLSSGCLIAYLNWKWEWEWEW